jgi:hypothetical protein
MSEDERLMQWLEDAARYFEARPTIGEDAAHWANISNAATCRKIASRFLSLLAHEPSTRDWMADKDVNNALRSHHELSRKAKATMLEDEHAMAAAGGKETEK